MLRGIWRIQNVISKRIAVEYAENMLNTRKSPKYLLESCCLNCALKEGTKLISLFSTNLRNMNPEVASKCILNESTSYLSV